MCRNPSISGQEEVATGVVMTHLARIGIYVELR